MYKKRIDGAYQDVIYGRTYMHVWVGGLVLHVGSTPSTILCFFLYAIRSLVPSQSPSLYIYIFPPPFPLPHMLMHACMCLWSVRMCGGRRSASTLRLVSSSALRMASASALRLASSSAYAQVQS